jgi:carbamoyl-phosphate synthase large subunit
VLEMNPRFGGGYPFSQIAGANLPAALIAWANGERVDTRWFEIEPNVTASKYDRLVVIEKNVLMDEEFEGDIV